MQRRRRKRRHSFHRLAQKPFIVPIPGTRSVDHFHENIGASNIQLTSADLREIDAALSTVEVHGGRMNEEIEGAEEAQALDEFTDEGIDEDHAFGFEFAEGNMNGPLMRAGGAQVVIG